jgi:serine/tyrosine/threonine adenylyltransferase
VHSLTVLARFDNSYAERLEGMYAPVEPTQVAAPRVIKFNTELADLLGLDVADLDEAAKAALFSGNVVPTGASPLAMAYAGHQFGHFVPQLGDGRAILLGEVIDRNGVRRDIQLKGPGRTPFSRRGDGRAALGPVLREYVVSEAMHGLGIPATRALAAVLTGERVQRETGMPGAVFTRIAASHLRVGTFQFFAARGDAGSIRRLADYAIDRHYPEARQAEQPYLALLERIVDRQAQLIARWLAVGFIHGVMNTDNMAISGETIDFGPCAFLDEYDPAKVFSSIDEHGRYAYSNQPAVAQWNLARLAETLLTLIDPKEETALELANTAILSFSALFETHRQSAFRRKIGLTNMEAGDASLIDSLLDAMHQDDVDFTIGFRLLCEAVSPGEGRENFLKLFYNREVARDWVGAWASRLERDLLESRDRTRTMRLANPAYIPRNHRIEEAIVAAVERNDFSPFHQLVDVLKSPYQDQPGMEYFALAPTEGERVERTFCGT